jgi:class 3 adenylate cyclase
MVDSTRLMAEKGDLVASAVFREFFEHAGRFAKEHTCLMIKFIGDGFLAVFENIDNVMPFVLSIESLSSQNLPNVILTRWQAARQVYFTFAGQIEGFRFSLHYGSVHYIETSYGSDVLGIDVNVAAYLNDLAQPHEIVISRAALEQMPSDYQALAGASESRLFNRVGAVEFRRINLLGL